MSVNPTQRKRKGPSPSTAPDEGESDKRPRREWTATEEYAIADYIRENYDLYKKSQKTAFAKSMISALKISCDDVQIKNKIQVMETKYKNMKLEYGKTGEGLTEGTMEYQTWEGFVKAKCHFYFVLDSVMRSRVNITPPFEINSDLPNNIEPTVAHDPIEDEERIDQQFEEEIFGTGDDDLDEEPTARPNPVRQTKQGIEKKKVMRKLEKGSSSTIADAMKLQAEISGQHYQRMDECKKLELSNYSANLEIERDRLRMNEAHQNKTLDMEERKIQNSFELEKMKLQRDKEKEDHEINVLKLKIELEKLKKV